MSRYYPSISSIHGCFQTILHYLQNFRLLRITYDAHASIRAFSSRAPFMGQSVSRGRSVTPCGTGPMFITHLHSFQCRTTSTGGHCFHWYSVTAFFDLSDAPITTISSTLGIEELNDAWEKSD